MIQKIITKNNIEMELSAPRYEDSYEWNRIAKIVANEKKYLLVEPEKVYSIDEIENKIKEPNDENKFVLVARNNGKFIGNITARRNGNKKMRHTIEFGLWLSPEYRNIGIGKNMILSMEKWGKDLKIKKVCLTVFSCNDFAKNLYLKMGYEIVGIQKNQIKIEKEYYDLIYMEKEL